MSLTRWLILPSALLLSLGCVSVKDTPSSASLSVTGLYRDPSTGTLKPTRYCWAEVYDLTTGTVADNGYLSASGQGTFSYTAGNSLQVRIFSRVEVPDGANFTLRGSVKSSTLAGSYATADAFNAVSDMNLTSTVGSGSSISLIAEPDAAQTDMAFNAVDQMVAFGLGMKTIQPGIRLPNLHAFFSPSYQVTEYPTVLRNGGGQVLQQPSGRAIFALRVAGDISGAAGTNDDLGDDAVLLEAYSHLLFADHSLQETGASALSYLRRDNDDQWVDRDIQSEPSIAFATGYGDFLACAFRSLDGATNPQRIEDTYTSSGGVFSTATYDLSAHATARAANQGEFYRGAVAISLWQTWRVALGGSTSALQALWDATARSQSGEYLNAPLGAYPTYLLGVKNLFGPASANWTNTLFQLGLESVQDPTPAYFASGALWTTTAVLPYATAGSFPTYVPSAGINFDRNQAATFVFTHGGGPRTLTVTTPSAGLVVDLIATDGLYDQAVATSGANGVITYASLAAGTYAVRVRVDYLRSYPNGTANWTLSIQ
ncbi:MAG: hypothetical protein HYZ13_11120 [Acidobacteria bacterium]|nr:hypothetical protein [Acidobacteriota bacterium]